MWLALLVRHRPERLWRMVVLELLRLRPGLEGEGVRASELLRVLAFDDLLLTRKVITRSLHLELRTKLFCTRYFIIIVLP